MLINKFSALELSRKFIKSALLVGYDRKEMSLKNLSFFAKLCERPRKCFCSLGSCHPFQASASEFASGSHAHPSPQPPPPKIYVRNEWEKYITSLHRIDAMQELTWCKCYPPQWNTSYPPPLLNLMDVFYPMSPPPPPPLYMQVLDGFFPPIHSYSASLNCVFCLLLLSPERKKQVEFFFYLTSHFAHFSGKRKV